MSLLFSPHLQTNFHTYTSLVFRASCRQTPVRWAIENEGVPDLIAEHPGPVPRNIYKVGLLTNLYFIIFPKSTVGLRKIHASKQKDE